MGSGDSSEGPAQKGANCSGGNGGAKMGLEEGRRGQHGEIHGKGRRKICGGGDEHAGAERKITGHDCNSFQYSIDTFDLRVSSLPKKISNETLVLWIYRAW
jgi:hypothetical protein